MRAKFLAAAAVLVVGALQLPAASQVAPGIGEVPGGVERLLDDYGAAYVTSNSALLDGVLADELREAELRSLASAADVPFTSFEVRVSTQFSGDLTSDRVQDAYPGRRVAVYHVIVSTRVAEETEPYQEHGAFTFAQTDENEGDPYDGWRLISKSDMDALGFFSPYHLWDEGPVTVLEGSRFVLLTHEEVAEEMGAVLDLAEVAMDRVEAFWPLPVPQGRYAIVAPATTEGLARILRTTLDLDNFVAFVAGGADRSRGWEPTGPRLFVHLSNLRRHGESSRIQILAHELIHAITRPMSGPHIPLWVEEGLADLGAGTTRSVQARGHPVSEDFPTRERFGTGSVTEIQVVYAQSQIALEVLEMQVGRERLLDFYEALGSARVVPGTESYHVRRAAEAVGWSYDEWLAAWQAEIA